MISFKKFFFAAASLALAMSTFSAHAQQQQLGVLALSAGPGTLGPDLSVQLTAKLSCRALGPRARPNGIPCDPSSTEPLWMPIWFSTTDGFPLRCFPLNPEVQYGETVSCIIPGTELRSNKALLQNLLQRGYLAIYEETPCQGLDVCPLVSAPTLSAVGKITRSGPVQPVKRPN